MANDVRFRIFGDVSDLERKLKATGKSLTSLGKSLSVAVTLPLTAAGVGILKVASDAEEIRNKFSVVFRSVGREAEKWSKDFAQSVGRSTQEIQKFSSGIGDILKPMGFATDEAFLLSKEMTKLALDVASFNNRQDADVIRAFSAALTGERESLKTLGIVINEADVQQEALRLGLVTYGQELSKTAKAQATYSLLVKNSKDAIGDLDRTQDSFANQLKRAKANLVEVSRELGENLIPLATRFLVKVNDLSASFGQLSEGQQDNIIFFGIALAALGPVLQTVGLGLQGLSTIWRVFNAVVLANPVVIVIGVIIGAVTLLYNIWKEKFGGIDIILQKFGINLIEIKDKVVSAFSAITDSITQAFDKIDDSFSVKLGRTFLGLGGFGGSSVFGGSASSEDQVQQVAATNDAIEAEQEIHNQTLLNIQESFANQMLTLKNEEQAAIAEIEANQDLNVFDRQAIELDRLSAQLSEKRRMLEESGQLTIEIEQEIADQIQQIKEQQHKAEVQSLKQKLGIEELLHKREVENVRTTLGQLSTLGKAGAKAAQSISLGLAIINTAQGVTAALARLDFVSAAIVAAQGAIEIATIANQSFAVGTSFIPEDMNATVHRGEMIVPKNFSDAIRSGDLTLSGKGSGNSDQQPIVFDFSNSTYNGVSDDFVDDIFRRASERIFNKTLAFGGA